MCSLKTIIKESPSVFHLLIAWFNPLLAGPITVDSLLAVKLDFKGDPWISYML